MHESTAYNYEHLPHDHSIHLTCGMTDCHNLLSIFMVHTDSSSSMYCTSKKDQWMNEWLWLLGRMALGRNEVKPKEVARNGCCG